MLNPVWLRTFKTLIEVGHFTQTAEKLSMTQPGVSQHINKLEQACGYSLIKREKKSFELTEQGRIVYQYALDMGVQEQGLFERLGFDDPYSGQCQLACSGSLALALYGKLLAYQRSHPRLSICLEAAPNRKILDDVQSGAIDLGIVTQVPSDSLFETTLLGREPLCLVLPQALADQPVTAQLLTDCGLIDHPDAAHYLTLYLDLCADPALAEVNPQRLPLSGYINQLPQILLPVAEGLGFTVLPQSAVENFSRRQDLFIAPCTTSVYETLYLVQKRHRQLPKRYEKVSHILVESLR